MTCIETRRRDGYTYRRYLLEDGSIEVTFEVPKAVISDFGYRKFRERLRKHAAGRERKRVAAALRAGVLSRADWKAAAVAHELGCTEARVRQIRKESHE